MSDRKRKLETLIGITESTTIEWKPSLSQINGIIETVSAFSNTEGGKIFVGISKDGKLLGVQIGKGTIENLTNQISQNTDPKIHPRITTKKIDGKEIIVIDVKESPDHLVLAFGRPYTERKTEYVLAQQTRNKPEINPKYDEETRNQEGIGKAIRYKVKRLQRSGLGKHYTTLKWLKGT